MNKSDVSKLKNGLYLIEWEDATSSPAAVGRLESGDVWFAPINWVNVDKSTDWDMVKSIEIVYVNRLIKDGMCGCGRVGKYSIFSESKDITYSCNKRRRCPDYAELELINDDLVSNYRHCKSSLQKIVDVNGMGYEYKTWAKSALDQIKS